MRTNTLLFLVVAISAFACSSRTESVVAAANGGTERYILLVNAAKTQDGNCSNSTPDPNNTETLTTSGDTRTQLLATIYQTDDKTYLLSVTQNYYTLVIPALPVLSGTKSDTGYSFTGTSTNTDAIEHTLNPNTSFTSIESYAYTVKFAAGSNKNFDTMTGTMETHHSETCTGPACNPNAYLADCTSGSTFSGVRLSNVLTTVGP